MIDEALLDEFRGPGVCEYCGNRVALREPHHWKARGMGGGGRLDIRGNLIALCATFNGNDCHNRAHALKIDRRDLLAIIAKREKRTPESIVEELFELLRRKKGYT